MALDSLRTALDALGSPPERDSISYPPGWQVDTRSPKERQADEERQRKAALAGSEKRVFVYRQAWLNFVEGCAEQLPAFLQHRLSVALSWIGGRRLSRRELQAFSDEAATLAARHAPGLLAAAAQVPEADWLRAREWALLSGLETPLPGTLVELGRPLAVELTRLLGDYGLGEVRVDVPGLSAAAQPGARALASRHCCVCYWQWPDDRTLQVLRPITYSDGSVSDSLRWEQVPGPVVQPWQQVLLAARALNAWDSARLLGLRKGDSRR
jgi:hypothetical protein